jgi:hypothetical protein
MKRPKSVIGFRSLGGKIGASEIASEFMHGVLHKNEKNETIKITEISGRL